MEGKLEEYQLGSLLGQGSYGKVYKGIKKQSQEAVALKLLSKKSLKRQDIKGLKQEAEIMQKLNHPYIVALKEFFETPEYFVIVTELADNDLNHIFEKEKKIPIERVKKYGKQILAAMLYLHEHRISHRDIKLQNILLKDDTVKLCDFGFAKKLSASTQFMTSIKGTPLYIAPEILIESKVYTHKVDIWSFGVLIYQLFVGYTPFEARSIERLKQRLMCEKVKFPENLPIKFKDLLAGILRKNPANRFDWHDIERHSFFKDQEALGEIIENHKICPDSEQQKKKQEEEEVQMEQSKVMFKIDNENQLDELTRIEGDLLKGEINGKQCRTNLIFYHKVISVLSSACRDRKNIPQEALKKLFKILEYLMTKVDLPSDKKNEDILRNKEILIAIIKVAENETSYPLLASQYLLIGLLLKLNFDYISVDQDCDEDLIQLMKNSLERVDIPFFCLENCAKVLGIMLAQGMVTFAQSYDFFEKLSNGNLLALLCTHYRPTQEHQVILECLQRVIHPVGIELESGGKEASKIFGRMVTQITQPLLKNKFISEKSPIDICVTDDSLKRHLYVLFELLRDSRKARQEFKLYRHWNQLLSKKNSRIFCLAYNYFMIKHEESNILTNEIVQKEVVREQTENKLTNVFLVDLLNLNIKRKGYSKLQVTRAVLVKLNDLLNGVTLEQKQKACQEIFGALSPDCYFFDEVLIDVLVDFIQVYRKRKEQTLLQEAKKIVADFLKKEKPGVSIKTLHSILLVCEIFPDLKIPFSRSISRKVENTLKQQKCWGEDVPSDLVVKLADLVSFYLPNDEKMSETLLKIFQEHNWYQAALSKKNMEEAKLLRTLPIVYKLLGKSEPARNYLAINGFRELEIHFFCKNMDLLSHILLLAGQLAKNNQNYYQCIEESNLITCLPYYLKEGNEFLKEKTLHFVGSITKWSAELLPVLKKAGVLAAILECLRNNGNSNKILKNAIFAIGNISYYNDQFSQQIMPMIEYFRPGLKSNEQNLILNTISTVSNLLRHSNTYLSTLMKTNLLKDILTFIKGDIPDNLLNYALNLLRKALKYPQFVNAYPVSDFKLIYEKKKGLVRGDNECMKTLKEIISK